MMGQLITVLTRPYTVLFVATGLALANLWRGRRESRARLLCVTIPFAALGVCSLPLFSYVALGSLEWQYPPREPSFSGVQAIVVLAGNIDPPDANRRRGEIGQSTLYRCLHAAELARGGGVSCPIVLSGGKADPSVAGPPGAELMRDFFLAMGISPSVLIVEGRSRTTGENAVECGKLLRKNGTTKIVLVTEATHMARAAGCFRKQGFEVVPSACRYRATQFRLSPIGFLPSASAAVNSLAAFHEWLGLALYWWTGAI